MLVSSIDLLKILQQNVLTVNLSHGENVYGENIYSEMFAAKFPRNDVTASKLLFKTSIFKSRKRI